MRKWTRKCNVSGFRVRILDRFGGCTLAYKGAVTADWDVARHNSTQCCQILKKNDVLNISWLSLLKLQYITINSTGKDIFKNMMTILRLGTILCFQSIEKCKNFIVWLLLSSPGSHSRYWGRHLYKRANSSVDIAIKSGDKGDNPSDIIGDKAKTTWLGGTDLKESTSAQPPVRFAAGIYL